MTTTEDLSRPRQQKGWRVVDIVTAAVLAVACAVIFWAWDNASNLYWDPMNLVVPGFAGILGGIWLLGGTLGGLVIRKPGAAFLVELIAAIISMAPGNKWGYTTIYAGLAQGIGAELVFALFAYRRWGLGVAALAGVGAAAVEWVQEYFVSNHAYGPTWNVLYGIFLVVSGALLAGALAWVLVRTLSSTGALDRFESGRDLRHRARA